MSEATVVQIKQLIRTLSNPERMYLAEWLAQTMETTANREPRPQRSSLYGICADLGTAPSAADIDETRHELWGGFPREDIA